MKNKIVLLFLIFLLLAIVIFIGPQLGNRIETQIQEKSNNSISYQAKTDGKGEVIVEVAPIKLSSKANSEFTIAFTTHSVDLSYDITNIAILSDDKGNQYKPLSWTGGKGGHHIEGVLSFPNLSQEASAVTLTIPEIDNQDRVFEWKLN